MRSETEWRNLVDAKRDVAPAEPHADRKKLNLFISERVALIYEALPFVQLLCFVTALNSSSSEILAHCLSASTNLCILAKMIADGSAALARSSAKARVTS